MKVKNIRKYSWIVFLLIGIRVFSQVFEPVAPPGNIGGVVLFNPNSNNTSPFIELGEQLILKFDDLDGIYKRYNYTIERYTHDWEPSTAFQIDYIKGFRQDYISDYKQSFNTSLRYTHYNLVFPNNKIDIKLSGNYVIKVFTTNSRKPIITKRFSVYEPSVGIQTLVSQGRVNTNETQTVSMNVDFSPERYDLSRNIQDVWGVMLKNNNWNEALYDLAPTFVRQNELNFNSVKNTFWAGNEYRWLDTKKRDAKSISTDKIEHDSIYHHYLFIDESKAYGTYIKEPDYEGGFYIRTVDLTAEDNIDTQADYIDVHFAFESFNPKLNTDIYVTGAFNDWELTDKYKMTYDSEKGYYTMNTLLKQGTYNYRYTFAKQGTKEIIEEEPEGNYWQTINLYTTLLYYRPLGQRYDLLIGLGSSLSR